VKEGEEDYGAQDNWRLDNGNDVIYGGDNNYGSFAAIHGGYGDDKIIGGSHNSGTYMITGDHRVPFDHPLYGDYDKTKGSPNDGDDVIDMGDFLSGYGYAYGQGGNDKIIGGIGHT